MVGVSRGNTALYDLHREVVPVMCTRKERMSRSTGVSRAGGVCRSKQGWRGGISKENTTGVQNPQYRITTDPVLWRRGSVSNKTHTTPCGGDPKAKQRVLSFQFSFHFLYCYYSIEPSCCRWRAGNIRALHWGGCLTAA